MPIKKSFRGEEAEFHLVVEGVKSRVLPDIDNELATSLGEFEDLDALREEIRSTLVEQSLQAYNDTYDTEIQNDAIEQATITYPPQMLEREVDNVISNLEERVSQQGLDMDLYLKTRSMDIDELRVEVTPVAEQRLKNTLLLIEIAKNEDIQVDPEQVQTQAQSTLNYISQTLTKQEARKLKTRDVYANLLSSITVDTLINSSLERLRDICRGEFEEIADNGEVTEEEADESEKTEALVEDNEAAIVQEVSVDEQVVDKSTTQKEDVVLESVSEHISAKKDDEEPTLETATDSRIDC